MLPTWVRLDWGRPSAAPPECVVHFVGVRIVRQTVRFGFGVTLADRRSWAASNPNCGVFGSMQASWDGRRFPVGRRSVCGIMGRQAGGGVFRLFHARVYGSLVPPYDFLPSSFGVRDSSFDIRYSYCLGRMANIEYRVMKDEVR